MNRAHILAVNDWSRPTLSVPFGRFLDHPLMASDVWDVFPPETTMTPRAWVYGCDGKWLGRAGVFLSTAMSPPTKIFGGLSWAVNRTVQSIGIWRRLQYVWVVIFPWGQ